jgi:hypothetical protein
MVVLCVAGLAGKAKDVRGAVRKHILGKLGGSDGCSVQHGRLVGEANKNKGKRTENAHAFHHAGSAVGHCRQPISKNMFIFIFVIRSCNSLILRKQPQQHQ